MNDFIVMWVIPLCSLILFCGVVLGAVVTKYRNRIILFGEILENRIRDKITHKDLFMGMVYALIAVVFCGILLLPMAVVGAVQISTTEPKMYYLLVVIMNTIPLVFLASIMFMWISLVISIFVGKKSECNSRCNKRKKDTL